MFRSTTLKAAGLAALFMAAALFGIASGVMFAFMGDLPGLPSLETYNPSVATRLLGRERRVIIRQDARKRQVGTDDLAAQHRAGREIVLVTSGAVGAGMGVLGFDKRPADLAELQACAAVGQSRRR